MSENTASPPDPTSPTQLRELLRRHQFRPRRALGQTFLVDANVVRKIVSAADLTGREPVVEIGAGAGAVTTRLTMAAQRVIAVEIDPALVTILSETVGDAAHIVRADVLTLQWADLLGQADRGRWRLVANLPYAITGPALFRLTEAREWVERLVIMVQEEVAQRLAAAPGSRTRGVLSVLLQALFDVTALDRVPRTCFYPRPRVDSMIVSLSARRPAPLSPALEPTFHQLVRAAFGTRRKTLANALSTSPVLGLSKADAVAVLTQSDIDQSRRAESLSEEEFLRLARALTPTEKTNPR